MSDRRLSAVLGALMVLLVAGLVDNLLLEPLESGSSVASFALGQLLGFTVTAGGVLLLGVLARSVTSLLVSAIYLVLGGFFALLSIAFAVVVGVYDTGFQVSFPASWLQDLYVDLERGPVNALAIIGTAMVLIGLAGIAAAIRDRAPAPGPGPTVAPRES